MAAFRDTDAGCECVVRAPMGLRMGVVYLVEHGEASNERKGEPMKTAEREETFLKEVCRIEANALLVPFITFNFESVHRKMQREMLEMLERGDMPRDKRAVEKT